MEKKKILEAILFLSPTPLTLDDLSYYSKIEKNEIKTLLEELNKDYEQNNSIFKIYRINNKYYLYLKKEILNYIEYPLLNEKEKTLISLIYNKNRISITKARDLVGESTINKLKSKNFIEELKIKNRKYLVLTDYFKKNFLLKGEMK